jgi:aminoglycoside phosphotransferase (APT) family kinase protein
LAHGDLKISNLHFSAQGRAIALLDLDTMGYLSLDVELGDAWRSWCNPVAEDAAETVFDLDLFEASARGYLANRALSSEDREALPGGVERICLELAARFAADAIHESYFGWNPSVAAGRGEHNLLRASGQFCLAQSVRTQRQKMERALA